MRADHTRMNDVGEVTEFGHAMKRHFLFDPKWTNLNHGSFGTYPLPVRNALRGYQKLTEAAPDRFLKYQYVDLLDKSRERIASLVNAPVDECVFVLNTTTGINTILRNLTWKPKDAIIYFDITYSGIEKTLISLAETNSDIHLRRVGHGQDFAFSLPATHPEILNAFSQTISRLIYEGYTPKVAVFDTIASLPAVRMPFERLTKMCKEYGILSVIDGAHSVGQIPLNLTTLDPDFFVSNCHKWLYTPRGCALFFVPKRNQHLIRTSLPTSHGYVPPPEYHIRTVLPPTTKPPFVNLFEFIGTADNSPYYCIPAALNFRQNLCGGEETIYNHIRDVAQRGADLLATILGTEVMDDLDPGEGLKAIGSHEGCEHRSGPTPWEGGLRDCAMANVLMPIKIQGARQAGSLSLGPGGAGSGGGLPLGLSGGRKFSTGFASPSPNAHESDLWGRSHSPPAIDEETIGPVIIKRADIMTHIDWMYETMLREYNTHVLIYEYNDRMWTRVSGQIYLELRDFEWLGGVLKGLCERIRLGESLRSQPLPTLESGKEIDLEAIGRGVQDVSFASPRWRTSSVS